MMASSSCSFLLVFMDSFGETESPNEQPPQPQQQDKKFKLVRFSTKVTTIPSLSSSWNQQEHEEHEVSYEELLLLPPPPPSPLSAALWYTRQDYAQFRREMVAQARALLERSSNQWCQEHSNHQQEEQHQPIKGSSFDTETTTASSTNSSNSSSSSGEPEQDDNDPEDDHDATTRIYQAYQAIRALDGSLKYFFYSKPARPAAGRRVSPTSVVLAHDIETVADDNNNIPDEDDEDLREIQSCDFWLHDLNLPHHGSFQVIGLEFFFAGFTMFRDKTLRRQRLMSAVRELQFSFAVNRSDWTYHLVDPQWKQQQQALQLHRVSESISASSKVFAHYLGVAGLHSHKPKPDHLTCWCFKSLQKNNPKHYLSRF
ncbi:hypothetical protein ACA910_020884 [Epithemia clementina (nom. ined.)]